MVYVTCLANLLSLPHLWGDSDWFEEWICVIHRSRTGWDASSVLWFLDWMWLLRNFLHISIQTTLRRFQDCGEWQEGSASRILAVVDGFKLQLWAPIWWPDSLPAGGALQCCHPPFALATCQLASGRTLGSEGPTFLLGERRGLQKVLGAAPSARHANKTGRVGTSWELMQMWVCETEHRRPGRWHSSFLLGWGVVVLSEPRAEWQEQLFRNVSVDPSIRVGAWWSRGYFYCGKRHSTHQWSIKAVELILHETGKKKKRRGQGGTKI